MSQPENEAYEKWIMGDGAMFYDNQLPRAAFEAGQRASRAHATSEYERGRRDGLEQAAQLCEGRSMETGSWFADAIRSLAATSGTPAEHNPARAPHDKFASLWCDACPRPTSGTPAALPECGCERDKCFAPISGYSCRAENEASSTPAPPAEDDEAFVEHDAMPAPPPADETLPAGAPQGAVGAVLEHGGVEWFKNLQEGTLLFEHVWTQAELDVVAEKVTGMSAQPSGAQAAPGPKCSHGVLMREFCQGCEDDGMPSAGAASHPLQDKPPAALVKAQDSPREPMGTCRLVSRPHPQSHCGAAWRPL